ncbi:MAG TPA: type I glyceraldehyde-3-phosphate dehydrogenase [Bacteroidales bacterium]|nr:type I glyceraldehyde-3-phosphate dehydrogenase [Bacteroidales bacterium]HRZ48631.1 type I glyceraldehyde-3-phosphate dehydrogenase [Bacteroidales bacterium]
MKLKIGINGLGRIGKLVFRLLEGEPDMEVVHLNDKMNPELLAHLLRYDTIHGRYSGTIEGRDGALLVNGRKVLLTHGTHPKDIPWSRSGVDIVVESSGQFKTGSLLTHHVRNGVKKVVLTCPADDSSIDRTVVMGINHQQLVPADSIISNASCTTNCVAMMLKVLHDHFIVQRAFMNTVHPFTNNQSLLDGPHSDFRRARAAVGNIIPTTTSAIRTIPLVMPEMKGRFDGFATRVPVTDGSFVELTAELGTRVTTQTINAAFRTASEQGLKGLLACCDEPIVSSDVIGNPHSAIFDILATKVIHGDLVQVLAWYDNESGYAHRIIDLLRYLSELEPTC